MSLSSTSNTINALGIFGRHIKELEMHFADLEKQYSITSLDKEKGGIFNHFTLTLQRDVPIGRLPLYIDLLRELKKHLPFKLKVSDILAKDDTHMALSFDTSRTQEIRDAASKYVPEAVVTTFYTKVVWFVPKENQEKVKEELKSVKEMVVDDFILVANVQNDENTIYSSKRFT